MLTIDHGTATARDDHGKFVKQFTLTYEKPGGDGETVKVTRRLPADGIRVVGPVISRMGDRDEVSNIRVTDAAGDDVTLDFDCFQN